MGMPRRALTVLFALVMALAACAKAEEYPGYKIGVSDISVSLNQKATVELGLKGEMSLFVDQKQDILRAQGALTGDGATIARGEAAHEDGAWLLWAEGLDKAIALQDGQDGSGISDMPSLAYYKYYAKRFDRDFSAKTNEEFVRRMVEEGLYTHGGQETVEVLGESFVLTRYDYSMTPKDMDRQNAIACEIEPLFADSFQEIVAAAGTREKRYALHNYYEQRYKDLYEDFLCVGSYFVDDTYTIDKTENQSVYTVARGAVSEVERVAFCSASRFIDGQYVEEEVSGEKKCAPAAPAMRQHLTASNEPKLNLTLKRETSEHWVGEPDWSAERTSSLDASLGVDGAFAVSYKDQARYSDHYMSSSETSAEGVCSDQKVDMTLSSQSRQERLDEVLSETGIKMKCAVEPTRLSQDAFAMYGLETVDPTVLQGEERKAFDRQMGVVGMNTMGKLLETRGVAEVYSRLITMATSSLREFTSGGASLPKELNT